MLTTAIFKFNPLGYHLLALVLRFLSCLLFYLILKSVWPKQQFFRLSAAVIFSVYPGFLQQPIALIYNHHLSILCLFLLSIYLMLQVVLSENKKPLWSLISFLATFHMFSIENFATLELIRPILLWIALHDKHPSKRIRLKKILITWLPYLVIFIFFIYWRVFIFKFPTYEPGFFKLLSIDPMGALITLFNRVPKDFFTVTAGAWLKSFTIPSLSSFGVTATYTLWGLVFVSFFFSIILLYLLTNKKDEEASEERITGILFTGFLLFLLSGSLVWVLDLPLEIEFAWDRMTLGFIPAVALLFGVLITRMQKIKFIGNIFLSLLVAFAVGTHFENEMKFKRDWENLRDLYWQFSWRIPDLEKNSAIISSDIELKYYSDNSLTSPLNLIYSSSTESKELDHIFFFTDVRQGLGLPELKKDIPFDQGYRSFRFKGNTSNMITIKYNPPACLMVMDRIYSNSITNPNLSDLQTEELKLTNLSLILKEPQNNPPDYLFGVQPQKSWCYYFQKADLARQYGNYSEITRLGDIVIDNNLRPRNASEWLPFLEGYSWMGGWDKVEFLLNEISSAEGNYKGGMCYTIRRIKNTDGFPFAEKMLEYLKVYNCP